MTETDPRVRTAYHESGHAAVAYILGRAIDVVSIRPNEHRSGVVIFKRWRKPRGDVGRTFQDVLLWPAEWRRRLEHDLCITLAGHYAEIMRPSPSSGYFDDDDEPLAKEIAGDLVPARGDLTERERLVLRRSANRSSPSDQEATDDLVATILNEHELSLAAEKAAYINWMRHHAARLVFSDRCRRLIEGLVPRLLEADVLSGRTVRRIFQEIEARR
jgi:hypothetical protein